jgi:hypothetical protein
VTWLDQTLDQLARSATDGAIGYMAGSRAAAEPTALAALALVAHGRVDSADQAAKALVAMQRPHGEVAVRAGEDKPGWPTSLATIAWCAIRQASGMREHPGSFDSSAGLDPREADTSRSPDLHIDRALQWLLANRGQAVERSDEFGHNTELIGWAYAEQTHSWVEPTAFAVLALKAAGKATHPATREGIAVLIDRQLPGGGLNYGNTYVLGQLIRPHVQPTGVGLLALAGETDTSNRLAKTIAWLRRSIGPETTPLSLGWAVLGLRAHGVVMPLADEWLATAAARVQSRDRSPYKLALLALAAKGWPL